MRLENLKEKLKNEKFKADNTVSNNDWYHDYKS